MASVVTNFGKASHGSGLWNNTLANGTAVPANFFIVLITSAYNFDSANPDHDDWTDIGAAAVAPSNYTGNTVARGGFSITVDELTNDRGEVAITTPPVLTASAALTNIRGFAIATQNSSSAGKILALLDFGSTSTISQGQTFTISGTQLLLG